MSDEEKKPIDERIQEISDAKDIFLRNDTGKRVLDRLSIFCKENKNPYVPNSFDGTAFNCGVQSVMQHIRGLLEAEEIPRQTQTIERNE